MIDWEILEVRPWPFMVRYKVYYQGKWIATFKYREDAESFIDIPFTRSPVWSRKIKELLLEDLESIKYTKVVSI